MQIHCRSMMGETTQTQPDALLINLCEAARLLAVSRCWLSRHRRELGIRKYGQKVPLADVEAAKERLTNNRGKHDEEHN